MTSCCPASAWGNLKNSSYKTKGKVEMIGDLPVYTVGEGSSKCVIWNYDVFGFDGGRTRQMADFLADNGYLVIIPDHFRGKTINPMTSSKEQLAEFVSKENDWDGKCKIEFEEKILPYAYKQGAKTIGTLGTCWGTWIVLKYSSYVEVKAGISLHPSHTPICKMLGSDEENLLKEVKCPQLFMSAGDDHENVKAGGLGKEILGDGLEIIEFPDMRHGWSTKGDLSVPEVERDVKKTFNMVLAFFGKYLH